MSIRRYKKEIEDAVVEVDRLNDARAVQLNRVKLVERERSALEVGDAFTLVHKPLLTLENWSLGSQKRGGRLLARSERAGPQSIGLVPIVHPSS